MKKIFMLSNLGFDNLSDFYSTMFLTKYKLLTIFALSFGAFSFQDHLWSKPEEIYFLWILLILDLITGIIKAFKLKEFNAKRLPRWAGISFTYSLLLFLSFNLSKYVPVFGFLPGSLYTLFCAVLFVSLVENLNKIGWINIQVYDWIKSKFGEFFNKNK